MDIEMVEMKILGIDAILAHICPIVAKFEPERLASIDATASQACDDGKATEKRLSSEIQTRTDQAAQIREALDDLRLQLMAVKTQQALIMEILNGQAQLFALKEGK